ncbi:response regulator [Aequorivita echinoideorum]|uniref:Response regulator n=1 Tax=Aequorivita echinoideorum TaxID=1549647 RepID=A0ABS5S0J4_9FLAO|nr:response regulator [Aequorivita echinoideorum]MBT0606699.1 response regulator [Aequorivita echinoideorum]
MKKIDLACIVDDDPIFVYGTRRMMELVNFCDAFLIFKNGKDALDNLTALIEAGQRLPDLILLDLNMPIMDGWQFLDVFTQIEIEKKIVIYIVSSSIDPKDFDRAKHYDSVSNFVVKPISIDVLKNLKEGFPL